MTRAKTRSGKAAGQMQSELDSLLTFLHDMEVRTYLEIGARYGDTFYDVVTRINPDIAIAVDLPGEKWGTAGSQSDLVAAVAELEERGHKCAVLFADSQHPSTVRDVLAMLGGRKIDAALIDGDHRFTPCMADYNNYGRHARFCAFHDIVGHGQRHDAQNHVEVPQVWAHVRQLPNVLDRWEFVESRSTMGIGVIEHA